MNHTTKLLEVDIDTIEVADRLRQDIGDIEALAEDISSRGLMEPLVVREENGKMLLIAGERRLNALKKLNYSKIPVVVLYDIDIEAAIEREISENIERKSFNRYELVLCGQQLEKIEKKKAEERMKSGGSQNFGKGRVDEIVAKRLKIGSHEQYRKCKYIVAKRAFLTDSEFHKWSDRKAAVDKTYKLIKERESKQEIAHIADVKPVQEDKEEQDNTSGIHMSEIMQYITYGEGNDSELEALNNLKSSNPNDSITYLDDLQYHYQTIIECFKSCKKLFSSKNKIINTEKVISIKDELQECANLLYETANDLEIGIISDIEVFETSVDIIESDDGDSTEIYDCDNSGMLYNNKDQKIGYIEGYNKKSTYSYIEYNENTDEYIAYNDNDKPIGKVVWTQ